MLLFIALKNEFTKCAKSPFSFLLIFSLAVPSFIVFAFIYIMPYDEFLQRIQSAGNDPNPYNYIYKWFQILFKFLLVPYYSIFLVWFLEIERKAKGWKFLNTLPLRFSDLIYSKLILVISYLFLSILISAFSLFLVSLALGNLKTDWPFSHYQMFDLKTLSIVFGGVFLLSIPLIIVLFMIVLLVDSPGLIIIGAISIGSIIIPYNPFQYYSYGVKSYWSLQLGTGVDLTIYLQSIIISIVLLLGLKFYNNKIYQALN